MFYVRCWSEHLVLTSQYDTDETKKHILRPKTIPQRIQAALRRCPTIYGISHGKLFFVSVGEKGRATFSLGTFAKGSLQFQFFPSSPFVFHLIIDHSVHQTVSRARFSLYLPQITLSLSHVYICFEECFMSIGSAKRHARTAHTSPSLVSLRTSRF